MKTKDLTQSFELLKILLDLETHVTDETILGLAIKNAISNKRPPQNIIEMIQSQAQDNNEAVKGIVGESLLNRITCIKF